MSKGKIWLKSAAAPNSLALSVICLIAAFLMGGVPFFIFKSNFMIFLSCERGGTCKKNFYSFTFFDKLDKFPNVTNSETKCNQIKNIKYFNILCVLYKIISSVFKYK